LCACLIPSAFELVLETWPTAPTPVLLLLLLPLVDKAEIVLLVDVLLDFEVLLKPPGFGGGVEDCSHQ
jgi:hypothetical protein